METLFVSFLFIPVLFKSFGAHHLCPFSKSLSEKCYSFLKYAAQGFDIVIEKLRFDGPVRHLATLSP